MKSFIYIRVSSKDQVKGTSLDKQKEICQIIAKNLGIFDLDFYEEPGISAETIKKRPVFKSLLEKIKQDEYDNGIGIAFDQDRLTRSTKDWSQISELFKEHRIRLHTSQGVMDFKKRDQRLTANIKGSLSEWHLDYIREQTRDGKRRRALEGEWNGGLILWGYRYNPSLPKGKRLEIDPEKAKLVRTLLVELESLPLCEIANEMNHRNIPSPKGGHWKSNKIYAFFEENRLLKYSGYVKVFWQSNGDGDWTHIPEGIVVKAKWSPIITMTERDRLLKKKENWKKIRVYPTKANKLLTGLGIASCGYCGTSVGTNSSHRNRDGTLRAYYGCMNRSCPKKPNFRLQKIDDLILNILKNIDTKNVAEGYNYFMRIQKERKSSGLLKDIDKRMDQIVSQRNRLVEKIGSGILEDEEAQPAIKRLRQTLNTLQEEKQKLTYEDQMDFLSLVDVKKLRRAFQKFEGLSFEQKRLGLKALIKRMTVFKDRLEIEFNFPVDKKADTKFTCPVSSTG